VTDRELVQRAAARLETAAPDEAAAVRRLAVRVSEERGTAKLWELLIRWGAADGFFLDQGIGGTTVCIIPPFGVPPVEQIEQQDGWQLWLIGLGYPKCAYPTLDEAVQAALDERALIEEQA
jgi:hypothetical protein